MAKKIRIGIIGTGMMAASHAASFSRIPYVQVVACCDVREEVAKEFSLEHNIPSVYVTYEALLAHPELDAVTIVTPDRFHREIAIASARAGKHILCEKPLSISVYFADEMKIEAEKAGVVAMVNLSYRKSSALYAAERLISAGKLGEIRHVRAHYLQSWLVSNAWGDWQTGPQWLWRLSEAHGSLGVLGDVGVHLLDFATYPVGRLLDIQCTLQTFEKNKGNRVGEYKLDANDSASMTGTFENGAMGVFQTTRWSTGNHNTIELFVHGSHGALSINLDTSFAELNVCLGADVHKARWKTRTLAPGKSVYEMFVQSIRRAGKAGASLSKGLPDFERGVKVQAMLEAAFKSSSSGQREPILYS